MNLLPESRYFDQDERCPHPEYWSSTDGDSTEYEVTDCIAGIVRGLQPDLVVETGAAFGQTTEAIADTLEFNGHGRLITFENDAERRNQLRNHDRATILNDSLNDSIESHIGEDAIDLAFFDSNYECRIPEFLLFRKWMRTGATVIFHDTGPDRGRHRIESGQSLREEIESELVQTGMIKVVDFPSPRGLTLGEVL